MVEQDLPPDAQTYNYAAGERPSTARVPRPAATPVPVATPAPTPSFRDTSTSFEARMARNQLPSSEPASTPFLDRAKALQERAQTGIKNLIGDQPAPTPAAPTNPNVLAARTGTLDQIVNAAQNQSTAATSIPSPSPIAPIKPGAQPNSFIGPKLNTTPSVIPTADKLPSLIDARFANKTGTEYPQ
jgi:hypothetical protein